MKPNKNKILSRLRKDKLKLQIHKQFGIEVWGEFCEKNAEVNRSQLFSILREVIFSRSSYWNNNTLAEALEVSPQRCSLYATGSDRQASWWSIMRLCQLTNKKIILSPTEIRIEDDT
jgi:hypothetical protein